MILTLGAFLDDLDLALGISGGLGQQVQEGGFIDELGTTASDQYSPRIEQTHSSEIYFPIASQGGFDMGSIFGEGGRI